MSYCCHCANGKVQRNEKDQCNTGPMQSNRVVRFAVAMKKSNAVPWRRLVQRLSTARTRAYPKLYPSACTSGDPRWIRYPPQTCEGHADPSMMNNTISSVYTHRKLVNWTSLAQYSSPASPASVHRSSQVPQSTQSSPPAVSSPALPAPRRRARLIPRAETTTTTDR